MVAEVFSAMIQGIEGQIVKIQVDISNGLPNFNMIGYLSNEVKESKERVRTALNNIGVLLPPKRISVNFAPADFRKCGTSFDVGVAAAILLAMDFVPETYIKDTLFVGELSLNGQICPISGVLPIVVAASKRGIKRCIVAQENVAEAAFVEQMEVVGCRNLEELFFYLKHGYIINDDSGEILENSGNISEDSGKECTIQDVKKSQEISESTRSLNLLVKDILENAGFVCVVGVEAVAEHSLMHQFGTGRPDQQDEKELIRFSEQIMQKIETKMECMKVELPGNHNYREYNGVPLKPVANGKCTSCGICAKECPVGAISKDDPKVTDKEKCISCMHCVAVCPQKARHCNKVMELIASKKMKKSCSGRKENKLYL